MTKDLATYFTFAVQALRGGTPVQTDSFLRENFEVVTTVADALFDHIEQQTIYRGIILPKKQKYLKPHESFTYISCSEDYDVAANFGDPTPSGFGSFHDLGSFGYVFEIDPPYRVLFHYSLFDDPKFGEFFKGLFAPIPTDDLEAQKEVMILQPQYQIRLPEPYKIRE